MSRRLSMEHGSSANDATTESTSERQERSGSPAGITASSVYTVAHATLPDWAGILTMSSLIFGGCCANVFALEAIIKEAPGTGTLVTFTQFFLTSILSVKPHLDFSRGVKHMYLRPRAIPLQRWLLYTIIFFTVNVLNNQAFKYKISIPLHIIIRSAGPVSTMAVGYVAGKRYTRVQVLAVLFLFLGVVQAAIADARSKGAQTSFVQSGSLSQSDSVAGFGIILMAMLLSAIMGVYTDRTYAKYGRNNWSENLFYSHTLSLPLFLLYWPDLAIQSQALLASPSAALFMVNGHESRVFSYFRKMMARTPVQLFLLIMNGFTQYLCIRGVNLLSARSSSLTVTIVLNIRKLVSLLLSISLFGNRLAPGVLFGALLVFTGGGLYALPPRKHALSDERATKKEE